MGHPSGRFLASYLHGPLGVIARTDEGGNDDPGDNRHHWYLQGAMGGNVGVSAERFAGTGERTTSFTAYDSFGNEVGPSLTDAGRYTWRGQEGTNHDRPARLVHMQARHYDAGLGRFVQADDLAWASFTTQGMNRYIYGENDPIGHSDPGGNSFLRNLLGVGLILAGIAVLVIAVLTLLYMVPVVGLVPVLFAYFGLTFEGLAAILSGIGLLAPNSDCEIDQAANGLTATGAILGLFGGLMWTPANPLGAFFMYELRQYLGMTGFAMALNSDR